MITLPNSSGVARRPWVMMVAAYSWPGVAGSWPSSPVAICAFCARTALATSAGVRPKAWRRSGLIQSRIEYSVPNRMASPTPGVRRMLSSTLAAA
jgi:hypothetical protein